MSRIEALRKAGVALAAMLALATPALSAAAQESEQAFFTGKTVRFVVGFGPGGGYDAYARMLAPYLSKTLGATVIVENRPGAGGLLALNGVYISPPDGLTMMIVNGTAAVYSQLTDLQGARYDLGKIGYIATLSAPPSLWTVGPHNQINTIAQALAASRKWRWAASGRGSGGGHQVLSFFPVMFRSSRRSGSPSARARNAWSIRCSSGTVPPVPAQNERLARNAPAAVAASRLG